MNSKQQVSVRLPEPIYQAFQGYLNQSELTQTQIVTNAIANYVGYQPIKQTLEDRVTKLENFINSIEERLDEIIDVEYDLSDRIDQLEIRVGDLEG